MTSSTRSSFSLRQIFRSTTSLSTSAIGGGTATFFIADQSPGAALGITIATVEARYGKPERIYAVDDREIMVYRQNLLVKVAPPGPGDG